MSLIWKCLNCYESRVSSLLRGRWKVMKEVYGSSVPGTKLGVPSSGDLERSLIGDPRAPLRQDLVPLVLLARVPLKPELILNPAGGSQRDDIGNGFLKVSLILRVPKTEGIGSLIVLRDSFSPQSHLLDACNTFFLPILNSEPFRMTNGLYLTLGSSSIGTRVHSRCRVGNEACESMDSSECSLDLTAEIEELRNAAIGEAPPPPRGDRLSPVGPLSIIGVKEVANWRKKFRLPNDVIIRIPGPFDRVSDFELDISRSDYSSGRDMMEQLLELPLERREVSFLVSNEALDRCSIRGVMSGSKGVEALAEYRKALEAMSARKAAVKRTAPVEDEEVQFVGSSMRQVSTAVPPSSSKKKSKASDSVPKTPSPASFDWSAVLSNLNAKAFPLVQARLSLDGDSFAAIRSLQGDLLQAASQLFHLGERMEDKTTAKAEMDALTAQLREGKDVVLAKEKEIKALKLKVHNQGEAIEHVATKNASLHRRLEDKEEDICESRYAAEVFDAEKAIAADSWEPAAALEQYKTVKTTEAELLGLPALCFDDEPQVPKRDGAPEPADGPPTN
ncbi:hypothetical protein HID58_046780 [Brassica napus]|uniref:Uncharacterized protein n=1 Tax=Brassica napus TaxID=3708 RepID=A0ABQ8AXH0_BRANA|nr:hypothetical protein HID58_046780 [Brassica napus]